MLEQIIFLKQLEAKLELLEARQLEQWHAIKVMRDELAKEMTRITESIQLASEEDEPEIAIIESPVVEDEVIEPIPSVTASDMESIASTTEEQIAASSNPQPIEETPIEHSTTKEVEEVKNTAPLVENVPVEQVQSQTTLSNPVQNATTPTSSINDQYNSKPSNLAEQLTLKPINDLKSAIGTNDRFLFIAQLFGGDANKFNQAIVNLNHCANLEAAIQHLYNNYKRAEWEQNQKTLEQLEIYLKRRYASN